MDKATRVQTLREAVCISRSANTRAKDMNTTLIFAIMDKIVGQTKLLSIGKATSLTEDELWIRTS